MIQYVLHLITITQIVGETEANYVQDEWTLLISYSMYFQT